MIRLFRNFQIIQETKLRYSTLGVVLQVSSLKIQLCGYLTKKYTSHPMRKNPHGKILGWEPK